jgi:hypothetical protein
VCVCVCEDLMELAMKYVWNLCNNLSIYVLGVCEKWAACINMRKMKCVVRIGLTATFTLCSRIFLGKQTV